MTPVIEFASVTITYPGATQAALANVDLAIGEGELVLVVGQTASGKTTLLRAINGLVPHFTGGTLAGSVRVAGRDTSTHHPRDLADVVGIVPQDPLSSFVTDTVEEELAYGMECLGVPASTMRRRVEETLDLLGLADVRDRPLLSLSGGQRQRVAIGAVLTAHPRVLVLDEPTSALDPGAAEEVLAVLQRLVHDLGITVVLAEHRLERVLEYADRVIYVPGDARPLVVGTPAEVMQASPVAPPVVRLGRLADWTPLPLSVRDARRQARDLRERLRHRPGRPRRTVSAEPVVSVERTRASYGPVPALRGVTLDIAKGEIVALMGRNGAGKSTLLSTLVGLRRPDAGTVRIDGVDPATLTGPRLIGRIGLVPQDTQLFSGTIGDNIRYGRPSASDADIEQAARAANAHDFISELPDGYATVVGERGLKLSGGQRQRVAIARALATNPPILIFDEATSALDSANERAIQAELRQVARNKTTLVIAHRLSTVVDAHQILVLEQGRIVERGRHADLLAAGGRYAQMWALQHHGAGAASPPPELPGHEAATIPP